MRAIRAGGTALLAVALAVTAACGRGRREVHEDELGTSAVSARTASVLESAADASATHAGHATFGVPPATGAPPSSPPVASGGTTP